MDVRVDRLDASLRADFFRAHADAAEGGWCFCVAWWVPTWEGWGDRTAEQNRSLREQLLDRGEHDGYLLSVDDAPLGWCQVGPRDRLAKLRAQYELEPDPDAWAISCFLLAPDVRGQGMARALLDGVIADLRERGVARVEAFPRRGEGLPPGEVWTGPEQLFASAGFAVVRDDPRFPIWLLALR